MIKYKGIIGALVIILPLVMIAFGLFCQWSAYCQVAQGLGQQPDVFAFIGWLATIGGAK